MCRRSMLPVLGLVLALTCAGSTAAQTSAQLTTITRSQKHLEKNRSTIAFFMHPTCTLRGLSFGTAETLKGGGYRLPCNFRFDNAFGLPFRSTLTFYYDVDGDLEFISVTSTTGMVNPFTAANFAVNWAKDKFKQQLQDDPQLLKLVERADARAILEYHLKTVAAE